MSRSLRDRRSDISATSFATRHSTSMAGCGWTRMSSCCAPFRFAASTSSICNGAAGDAGHFICGNVMYAKPRSRHLETLYRLSMDIFASRRRAFGDIGPKLLSHYIASDVARISAIGCSARSCSTPSIGPRPNSLRDRLLQLSDYLSDDRVFGIHLWNCETHSLPRDSETSLLGLLSRADHKAYQHKRRRP